MDKIVWAVCLENAVNMVCWTILAVLFNKWWIALFSALFMTSIKNRKIDEE